MPKCRRRYDDNSSALYKIGFRFGAFVQTSATLDTRSTAFLIFALRIRASRPFGHDANVRFGAKRDMERVRFRDAHF